MMDPNNLEQGGYPPPAETAQAPQAKEQNQVNSDSAPQQAPRPAGPAMPQTQAYSQAPFTPPQPNYAPGYYGAPPMQNYPNPYQNPYYGQQAPVPPPPPYSQQPPYPQQPVNPQPNAKPQYKPEGLAVAAMVLGICSVVMGSLVCAILALVFSSRVKGHYPNGNLGPNTTYVKVGKICGAVGLGISIFAIVLIIVCLILLVTNGTIDYLYNYPYYLNY